MRSAHVFSVAEPGLILEQLDRLGVRSEDEWLIAERLWARVCVPPDWPDGFDDLRSLIERDLGDRLALVTIDVPSADDAVRPACEAVVAILSLGPGLAFDDHSETGWTAADLAAGRFIDGRAFLSWPTS